jgi:hypothetical protein
MQTTERHPTRSFEKASKMRRDAVGSQKEKQIGSKTPIANSMAITNGSAFAVWAVNVGMMLRIESGKCVEQIVEHVQKTKMAGKMLQAYLGLLKRLEDGGQGIVCNRR